MLSQNSIWVGIDWADSAHAVCFVEHSTGSVLKQFEIQHSQQDFESLVEILTSSGQIRGIAIETSKNLLVTRLLKESFPIYALNPKVTRAWHNNYKAQASKTDQLDAWILADGLRKNHEQFQPLNLADEETRKLENLCRHEEALIASQTSLILQLKACLKAYFPTILGWFGDWNGPSTPAFLIKYPTPKALANASKRSLTGFLKKRRIGVSKEVWQRRIESRARATDWVVDQAIEEGHSLYAVSLAKQLQSVQASLKIFRKRITELFEAHSDALIFKSLPGAGEKLAPRLLCHFGSDRGRFKNAKGIQQLAGCVPVTDQSGQNRKQRRRGKVKVIFRRRCQKGFRSALHLFAWQSLRQSGWAKSFYDLARGRGQSQALALRNLGAKWIKIIYRMWQEGKTYSEEAYVSQLRKRGSPIYDHMVERLKEDNVENFQLSA